MSKQSRAKATGKAATSAEASAVSHASLPSEPNPFFLRWGTLLASGLVVLVALAAYHNSFSGPFILDDWQAITDNPTIRQFRNVLSPALDATTTGRPVLNLTYALNYALDGTNVRGYHAFNLLIHTLAGLTLLGIVRRTLRKPALNKRFGVAALPLALAVAVLWVVHPLQTEAVTYISERAESLMGLFYLLTLYCFIRSQDSGDRSQEMQSGFRPSASSLWSLASVLSCLLGVMCKESIVTAPVMTLLYDRTFVAGSFGKAWQWRWRYYLGLVGTWLVLAFFMSGPGLHRHHIGFDESVGWWDYALTSCRSLVLYLKLALWPHPLVLDYGNNVVHGAINVLPDVLVLAALAGGTVIAFYRWPVAGFAGAWFFLILSPTSSVVPIAGQPMAEHRVYLSLAAVVASGVLGLFSLLGKRSLVVFAALAVGLGWLTVRRNEDYRSELSIWSDTANKCPNNERALNNLGMSYMGIPGDAPEAVAEFQAALRINPDDPKAHSYLGRALARIPGRLQEAAVEFATALRISPDDAKTRNELGAAHNNLGLLQLQNGNPVAAMAEYKTALEIRPDFADAHNNLGFVLSKSPGRLPEAISEYEAALRIDPNLVQAHYNLGAALLHQGRYPAACEEYNKVLEINPRDFLAHLDLGLTLLIMRQFDEAITQLEAALQIKPDDPSAQKYLELAQNMLLKSGGTDASEHPDPQPPRGNGAFGQPMGLGIPK